ncbi:MAG TPA: hypothetical protein DDY52_03290 [Candidatus Moranbacteria bacterium]|nr:hypothetical protein [Candidatus Moranbacteria bacterium]
MNNDNYNQPVVHETIYVEPKKPFFENLYEKHEGYISALYGISFFLSGIYAFIRWLKELFATAHDDNFIGFIFVFLFQSFIMAINTILGGIMFFIILLLISVIPYLIYRGLTK